MLSKIRYYRTLGSLIDSLSLLIALVSVQELQLVSGVCRMCWRPCIALIEGVGYGAVDAPWPGVPSVVPSVEVGLGTLHTSFGAMMETSVRLPLRVQSQIGDKPRLESCVVSQAMADSLGRLPLEGF